MKTLAKIAATLMLASFIATTATVAHAAPKMMTTTTTTKVIKKKGYVHAHTFVKKNGTVVHVKGHYRHHGKKGGKMVVTKTVVKKAM